ncbi:Homeobox-like_domain superfamily [Hexamita inflata]|uniref:Homeobox-like_domain superfamily n=1 Tax=Hexamita inflata TaxID=28002 RepID=A0ABP1HCB8_9EUKA
MNKRTFAPKVKWSQEEVDLLLSLYPVYGCDYPKYTAHLNRTYSQIKGFMHNMERKSPEAFQSGIKHRHRERPQISEQYLDVAQLLNAFVLLVQ